MIKKNFVKEKLEEGNSVIGTWSIIPSPVVAEIIASAGLDFIIIDQEHGPISFETAQEMAIACELHDVSPIMRVGNVNESEILKALDIGMHGIQIPNVENEEDVENIIKFSKYPPIGNRGFSPFTRAGRYSIESAETLTREANKNSLVGINIEGVDAIENIDKILQIEHLDVIFIGLFDLSKALGVPGKVNDPRVLEYLELLTKKIIASGKYPGTIATNHKDMEKFLNLGIKYLLYLVDCEQLRNSYSKVVREFKNII